MKKIAIQTCVVDNYGACLQAYALQTAIESLSKDYRTAILPFDRYSNQTFFLTAKSKFINFLSKVKHFNKPGYGESSAIEYKKFRGKFLHFYNKKFTRDRETFVGYNDNFDTFVCGSDIIWNPNISHGENLWYDMFGFVKDGKNKVAYAPSFGITKFPSEYFDEAKKYLDRFDYISCREGDGVKLLEEDFNIVGKHVLDPTLLLQKEKWQKVMNKKKSKNPYAFFYMFEDFPFEKMAEKILTETNYDIEIIPFKKFDKTKINDKRIHFNDTVCGPRDFIRLIDGASLVIANSLHALAFSINLNTPFVIFDRDSKDEYNSINSRMRSMVKMFNFQNRIYSVDEFVGKRIEDLQKCDFTDSNEILKKEREKSFEYLSRALKGEK